MKQVQYRILSLLLALLLICSWIPSVSVEAAGNQPTTYSDTSNSGTRGVTCTSLSGTGASAYYTGNYTFEKLSAQGSSTLLQSLRTLMTSTHTHKTSYADCKNKASNTDCEANNGKITLIYTSYQATASDFQGGGSGWDREHVWPKNLGGFENSGAGADLHHVRPSDSKVNNSRSNKKYGEVSNGSAVNGSYGLGGYGTGSYFEPLDNVKGDVARICLYIYVRYGGELSKCSSITNVFQSVDVLLEWMEQDPVDTWEMGRNEVVEAIQGNRNVFIDYPELAWTLFGQEVPANMSTPSGGTGSGGNGGGSTTTCQHTNTEIRNSSSASCTQNGYTGDTYCKDCGEKLSSGSTITGGHIEKQEEQKDATCCADGATGRTYCGRCGQTLVASEPIPATGNHVYGDWEQVEAPTETETGLKQRVCTVGGHVDTQVIPALGSQETPTDPDTENTDPTDGTTATDPEENTQATVVPDDGDPVVPDQSTGEVTEPTQTTPQPDTPASEGNDTPDTWWIWVIVAVAVIGVGTVIVIILVKKKK